MEIKTRINLGDKVKDVIGGFKGTATCVQVALSGCIQFLVESDVSGKGKQETTEWWIDEQRLKVTKKSAFKPQVTKAETGGMRRQG